MTDADADPLVRTLAEIVVELAYVLEDAIGVDGEPRSALNTLEWIAFTFDNLAPDQRRRLAEVVAELAAEAEPGPRREFMESFPSALGLLEDDAE
jgi:hypothetical protein